MHTAIVVALVAGSAIGLELIQTRVLSVLYYNHVVYLTITVALMGFGISGVLVSLSRVHEGDAMRTLERLLLAYAISLVCCLAAASYMPAWFPSLAQTVKLIVSYLLLVVPFLFAGAILGTIFMMNGSRIHWLYGADLTASAFVVVAFGFSIQSLGAAGILIVCGVAAFIAYVLQCARRGAIAGVRAVLVASGFVMFSIFAAPQLVSSQPELYKTAGRFRLPEYAGARLERGEWTSIAKIDVWADSGRDVLTGEISPNASRKKMITQDADAHTILWDSERLNELSGWAKRRMPYPSGAASIAYLIRPRIDDALVIGVGGGNDIVTARAYGAQRITGVELNPATVDLVNGPYRAFAGWPDWPGVTLIRAEGREYVRNHSQRFDTLMMSGVDTFAALNSGAYVLSENYLYTVEAVGDYLDAIKDDGVVAIYRWFFHQQPRESLRLANLVASALEARGVSDARAHLMVIGEGDWAATLFRKTPFTSAEVRAALDIVASTPELAMVHVPRVFSPQEQETVEAQAFARQRDRLNIARGAFAGLLGSTGEARRAFEAAYPYRVDPVYDSRPFFFEYLKKGESVLGVDVSHLRGGAVHYTLHVMLGILTLISAIAMLGPLALRASEGIRVPGVGLLGAFFVSLGVAFMLIEISVMQWLNLFLGDPMRSLMVVLGGLLMFAGLGSMLAGRSPASNVRKITFSMIAVACLVPLWLALMPGVISNAVSLGFAARVAISLASLAPLGILMGVPFACGLSYLERVHPRFVPWAWGLNGLASVMASILAVILAMQFGFDVVVLAGGAVYLLGALVMLLHARRFSTI